MKQTCRVETHNECKQTYITVPQLQAQSDTALAPKLSGTYFKKDLPMGTLLLPLWTLDKYYSNSHELHYKCMRIHASGNVWVYSEHMLTVYDTDRER